jgi:hypothetical protein
MVDVHLIMLMKIHPLPHSPEEACGEFCRCRRSPELSHVGGDTRSFDGGRNEGEIQFLEKVISQGVWQ